MSANNVPIFHDLKKSDIAQLSVANSNRNGSGTIVDIFSAGSNGSSVLRINVVATGNTTAGVVRIFAHNGSTYMMIYEMAVTAVTPSGSTPVWSGEWIPAGEGYFLKTGWKLGAAPLNAETFNVIAQYGDF